MGSVTQFLNEVGSSEANSTENLLPEVYRELRILAASRLRPNGSGQTLQATSLVHEAYMRLVGPGSRNKRWQNRTHFFAAASEAMRRIVIDIYRRKNCHKRGGASQRLPLNMEAIPMKQSEVDLFSINEAIDALELLDPQKALLVKLRFFVGMSMKETAEILNVSLPTAERYWRYTRAFLADKLQEQSE
jgi:RNA polymerase sigma factor (TIGR02999 family)